MLKKIALPAVAIACAGSLMVAIATQSAEAGPKKWHPGAAAAGGFIAGALVGTALAQPRYVAPAPVYPAPPPPQYVGYRPAPWTPAWYQYCSAKYRSFNPNTGYFMTYSGHPRFCR